MIALQTGIAYTLVANQVYALPAKAVMVASSGAIEVSMDGVGFTPVTLTNQSASLASMFVRSPGVGTLLSLKDFSVMVKITEGGGASSGDVVIEDSSPTLTLINSSGDPGVRRWQIKVVGSELQLDSQSDAGVSYGRPLNINVYNGGINCAGPVSINSPMSLSAAIINIGELPFSGLAGITNVGTLASISDSTVNTPGSVIAGGGSFHVLGRYNGTNWKVIGV